jgi:hypothetical protein
VRKAGLGIFEPAGLDANQSAGKYLRIMLYNKEFYLKI